MRLKIERELLGQVRGLAKKRRIRETEALTICFEAGIVEVSKSYEKWIADAKKKGLRKELEDFLMSNVEKIQRLMDLNAKIASDNFESYEMFNSVTTKLIPYLGKRAIAKRLQKTLEERGIHFDISPGEVPNVDDMTRIYLFKKQV